MINYGSLWWTVVYCNPLWSTVVHCGPVGSIAVHYSPLWSIVVYYDPNGPQGHCDDLPVTRPLTGL